MNGSHFHSFGSGLESYAPRILVIGACLLACGTYNRFAVGATLQELLNGGSIIAGDSQISDWELISLDSTAAVHPDLSQIEVVPLDPIGVPFVTRVPTSDGSNPGLRFIANGQLQVSGVEAVDLVFKYRVDSRPGSNSLSNHALALDGIRFGSTGGLINITDEVTNRFGGDLGSTQVLADIKSNLTQALDTLDFAPQTEVSVISKVSIQGFSTTDAINLSSFTQSFSQTGPAILPGNFNQDKVVDAADIQAMLTALTDLNAYQAAHGLSDDALVLLGDLNGDHVVNNADLRSLLELVAAGGGQFAIVPEQTSVSLATVGLLSLVGLAALKRRRLSVSDRAADAIA